jgi:excisionase family DNA binding protein
MTRSVPEEAKRLGVAAITLYKACQNGEYPAIKIGRSVRIPINQSKVG